MFRVTVTEKDGQAESYSFDNLKSEISIGRVKGNDIVLPKGNVSKRHSRIVVKDGKFIVVDLKSTNGTFVNGRKIASPQVIKTEDKVYIGDFVLSVDTEMNGDIPAANNGMSGSPISFSSASDIEEISDSQPIAPLGGPMGGQMGGPLGGAMGGPPVAPPGPPLAPPGGAPLGGPARPLPGRLSSPGMPAADPLGGMRGASPSAPGLGLGGGLPPRSTGNLPRATTPSMPAAAPPPRPTPAPMGDSDEVTPLPSSTSSPRGVAPAPERAPFGQPTAPPERAPFNPSSPPRVATEPAPPMSSPPLPAPMSAPPLRTPGVGAVVPKPRFVQQRDAAFAQVQARAAEAFFAAVDPRELPAHYPPSPEDRHQLEGAARDAAGRAGAGADLANHLLNEAVGLGPLDALLDDPTVEEIYVNSFDQVLYKQEGRVVSAPRAYSHPDFLYLAAQRLLAGRMEEPDAQPLEEVRFSDGTRVTLIMPPLAPRGPALIVRKHRAQAPSLQELTQRGALSPAMAQLLTMAVEAGRNLLIAGPRQSGRLELLGALGALIPEGSRVVTVEDAPGLQLPQSSAVRLESNADYDLRYLVKAALRLQPDRILLNALSGPEAYDWVTAAAAGSFGSMALGHGLNAQDALGALTTLAQLGAPALNAAGLREQVARAVHLVVVTQRDAQGLLRVQQIAEVQGVDFDDYRLNDIFTFRPEPSGGVYSPTGYVPMFCEALRAAGIAVDSHLFQP